MALGFLQSLKTAGVTLRERHCEVDQTFTDQLDKLYDIVTKSGDMTLVVEVTEKAAAEPSTKRKRVEEGDSVDSDKNGDDTSIGPEEKELLMSSSILRAASPVFDRMLQNDMMEKRTKQITVHADSVEDVKNLAYFMCTDKLKEGANVMNLIQLAHEYQMRRLIGKCAKQLIDGMTQDTFVETAKMFDKFEINGQYQRLVDFGKANAAELKKRDDYESLSFVFRCILSADIK